MALALASFALWCSAPTLALALGLALPVACTLSAEGDRGNVVSTGVKVGTNERSKEGLSLTERGCCALITGGGGRSIWEQEATDPI